MFFIPKKKFAQQNIKNNERLYMKRLVLQIENNFNGIFELKSVEKLRIFYMEFLPEQK